MRKFEISSRAMKNGRRKCKIILCEVYPDSTVDEVNEVGTKYNLNGISFIESYVRNVMETVKGTFIRSEFVDCDRTQIEGHGMTDIIDGSPVFEDASTIGVFNNAYIEETTDEDGEKHLYLIGEGELDAQCYHNFIERLMQDIKDGNPPSGSVEIMRTDSNDVIQYKYGYKDFGRIPVDFQFSGYAIIGVQPSDSAAMLIELNQKGENTMDEAMIKQIVEATVAEMNNANETVKAAELNCAEKIGNMEAACAEKDAKISELNELVGSTQQNLDEAQKSIETLEAACAEKDAKIAELNEIIATKNKAEKMAELNSALAGFTGEQKAYAEAEINAFNADPLNGSVTNVVNKVYEGIGKAGFANAAVAEQNSAPIDIFGEIAMDSAPIEDSNIF